MIVISPPKFSWPLGLALAVLIFSIPIAGKLWGMDIFNVRIYKEFYGNIIIQKAGRRDFVYVSGDDIARCEFPICFEIAKNHLNSRARVSIDKGGHVVELTVDGVDLIDSTTYRNDVYKNIFLISLNFIIFVYLLTIARRWYSDRQNIGGRF